MNLQTIKVYEFQGLKCALSVNMDNYMFVAQVKEAYDLVKGVFKSENKSAITAMKELEENITTFFSHPIDSWSELTLALQTSIEKSDNNHFLNSQLVRKIVLQFVFSILGSDAEPFNDVELTIKPDKKEIIADKL